MGAARRTLVPGFKPRRTRDNSEGGVRHESPSELPSSELSGASEQNRARTYKRSVEVYVWACSSVRRNDHCRLSALALIGTNSRALHPTAYAAWPAFAVASGRNGSLKLRITFSNCAR